MTCLLLVGLLLAAPAAALEEAVLAQRLAEQPLPAVYRWLQRQPVPALPVEASRYHRWLGEMAMQLDNPAAAVTHFEAAILANPYALGARLEQALAYTELGNVPAARGSLRALHRYRGDAELPPEAAQALGRLEQRLAESSAAGWQDAVAGTLSVAQGFDSNANLGSRHSTIPLNLFGMIPDEARLADASRAQPSHYSRVGLTSRLPAGTLLGGADATLADWQLLGGLGAQRYHDLERLQRRDAYLGAEWQPDRRHERVTTLLQYQHVAGIGTAWYLDADYRRLLGGHWLAELGVQWQEAPGGRRSFRLKGGVWREWQGMLLWGNASWQVRPDRPAGDTWRLRLGAQSPRWRWGDLETYGYAHLERRQDTDVYNLAFFGDQRRRETTATLGARLRHPIDQRLALVVDAGWERTRARLELFELERWRLEAALQWRW
ncbi:MAG: tetratricopeptide repeat protein [Pseudomonadota bacterium]